LVVAFRISAALSPPQPTIVEGRVVSSTDPTAGAVVYLVSETGRTYAPPLIPPVIDQFQLRFQPPVLAVTPGTSVEFRNSDPILHNVFGPEGPGDGFDLGRYPRNESRSHSFSELGAHVILCHVHPEMVAYVVVVPTPYNAVVDQRGWFRIEGVEAGRYTIRVWQRGMKPFSRQVDVRDGTVLTLSIELARQ
jgi:plastocyanin